MGPCIQKDGNQLKKVPVLSNVLQFKTKPRVLYVGDW